MVQSLRSSRRPVALAALVAFAIAILPATASVGSARAAGTPSGFGPIPYNGTEQSRCQSMSVGSHIVLPGHEVTGHTGGGICGAAPKDINWSWSVGPGPGVKGCGKNDKTCSFKASAATNGYALLCINGSNIQGPWQSCDYYGVPGKGVGIIDGTITDKDGGPVAGAVVTAYGQASANTTTGTDGYYAMTVKPGKYRVLPSGGPHGKSAPTYVPNVNDTTVADGATATAGFQLQAGIELELHFAQSTVPADGLHVVNGTITTTEFGKPLGGVAVQLEAMPGRSGDAAVTASPRASICNAGTRLWPTGTMAVPDGNPVSVTTDSTGHYSLEITVGTTPGIWELDAWAKNPDGSLSSDTTSASDTQRITFKSLVGKKTPADFINEFDVAAKATTALQQASPNASPLVNTLAQTTATNAGGVTLGGLGYGLVNAPDGQSLLVFDATKPPVIDANGALPTAFAANADDLVLDPAEWTGAGLAAAGAPVAALQTTLNGGSLQYLPTLRQFEAGSSVLGWKLVKNSKITLFSQSFEYLGWGYPGIAQPGACY